MKKPSDIYILFGCEESQECTIAFREKGFNAFSNDIKPCSGNHPEWHLQMDVFEAIKLRKWDCGVFFPDCTYITISAEWAYKNPPYHQKIGSDILVGEERRQARKQAIEFAKRIYNSEIPILGMENPVGVLSTNFKKPNQIIQPYQFGNNASKKTCLWLKGLPILKHTTYIEPRLVNGKQRWGNQTDSGQNNVPPSKNQASIRSKTYTGIAQAMATQWGSFLLNGY